MEALSRTEYPAALGRLSPGTANARLAERVKKIGKINSEIAGWLQERRKVEEAYVAGLKKLAVRPLADLEKDLGIFDAPWKRIVESAAEMAKSHTLLADRIEKDIEQPLRNFASSNKEMSAMSTQQGNLAATAKELEDAQERSDKLSKKGGKASAQKVDFAQSRLQSATSSWDGQAPFIFETLQILDERRLNHLRDVLTQYQTLEMDNINRNQRVVESTLGLLLEVETAQEIQNWSQAAGMGGKPANERRSTTRQSSIAGSTSAGNTSMPAPPTPASTHTDNQSEHSEKREQESKLKSRFGTMLGRRRQSIHGGFGRAPSPNKGFMPFGGRNTASRDGRPSPSPRASSNNLRESPAPDNRLSSLAESPPALSPTSQTNGHRHDNDPDSINFITSNFDGSSTSRATNGAPVSNLPDLSDVQPPPGPPPSHVKSMAENKDAEGFSVPAPMNDPISQAQQDAALEGEQPQFKLDIRKDPIPEQDADAQAALSSVANTLRSSTTPSRKAGTVRGRRDVRNTIFMPPMPTSLDVASPDNQYPPSPGIAPGRAAALAALSSGEHAGPPTASDTTSIRSGHSLANHAVVKHTESHTPGLHASIIETVSVTFENGVVKTSKINGEIALVHNRDVEDSSFSSNNETIRINNFPNMEAIGPNRTFIHPVSEQKPDEFTIDLTPLSSKASVAFTYRVHVDEATMTSQGPLLLKQAWKPQGDKLGLVIEYSLNPAFSSEPVAFNNLVLVGIYQGARAIACQTKPTGTHLKEKSLVYWRLGDVTLSQDWHKIICRVSGTEGAMPEPGHVEARWEINNPSNSPIGSGISISKFEQSKGKGREENDDPFADATSPGLPLTPLGTWTDIGMHKKLVSGKYEAR
ncbi:Muniscin C-terminal mu homology domain-containing protein [Rhexocercosporidium sp. MPI-PUGE-AT-0058]|nr:Muniscin C-terminal mu homology domain-containing protein [Rhexocercosporidium sp. MPI-PUGE-AT-0058]